MVYFLLFEFAPWLADTGLKFRFFVSSASCLHVYVTPYWTAVRRGRVVIHQYRITVKRLEQVDNL